MIGRNSLAITKTGYFKHFNKIFTLGLSVYALGVITYMLSKSEDYNPSVAIIARELGIHRNTVYKAIKELVDANVLTLVQNPSKGKVALYRINPPSAWQVTLERQLQDSLYK